MEAEYLIIGQGIAGTMLSFAMQKAGISFILMDDPIKSSSSKVASGIINPVTGRRIVKTWMIDELLISSFAAYRELESTLGIQCLKECPVLDFFPTAQMRLAFTDRIAEVSEYLFLPDDENDWLPYLNYDLGYGIIRPSYLVDMSGLLAAYRKKLSEDGVLIEASFAEEQLTISDDGVTYRDISASRLIFCDGAAGSSSKYFRRLPFALNKGEALIVEIPGISAENILKKGISIVPWKDGLFWIGSSHEWNYAEDGPTAVFRERTLTQLKSFCKLPYRLVDHLSGIRPATLERRPFVGFHPNYPQIGIFNGLGTKGCSLAPHFASEFVRSLQTGMALMPDVDVRRFTGVLSRKST